MEKLVFQMLTLMWGELPQLAGEGWPRLASRLMELISRMTAGVAASDAVAEEMVAELSRYPAVRERLREEMRSLQETGDRSDDLGLGGGGQLGMGSVAGPNWDLLKEDLESRVPRPRTEPGAKGHIGEEEEESGPRVLNANFRSAGGADVEPHEALVAGEAYDLLVDIGPKWDKRSSIVTGDIQFPEKALPPNPEGHILRVLFVSDNFTPHIAAGDVWLPEGRGRSHPIVAGERAPKPGQLALRLRAPDFPARSEEATIDGWGRLSLYYENNLLQSALVRVSVARERGVRLSATNTAAVDYRLSGSFQNVAELATRAVRFSPDEAPVERPVSLNLTVNDDGAGGHRLIYKGPIDGPAPAPSDGSCRLEAYMPYDAKSGEEVLDWLRDAFIRRFYNLDAKNQPVPNLDDDMGKGLDAFKDDLWALAEQGNTLRLLAFAQPNVADERCTPALWAQSLFMAMDQPSILQVSRTGQAQYVFPWAFVYEYPLGVKRKWRMCDIVDEEWHGGRRTLGVGSVCKYRNEDWHQEDVICPYGFWGLKHILEQPASVNSTGNVRRATLTSPQPVLTVGLTQDVRLDLNKLAKHVEFLKSQRSLQIGNIVYDWSSARAALQAPEIVYFFCHGMCDDDESAEYLSLGRPEEPEDRVYLRDLASWRSQRPPRGPDLQKWSNDSPLVVINGCHTADLKPGKPLSYVQVFADMGAGGVIGTEVDMLLSVGVEVGQALFSALTRPADPPVTVGQAVREIRWQLANKGNLLGLAYTVYARADLHLQPRG